MEDSAAASKLKNKPISYVDMDYDYSNVIYVPTAELCWANRHS